MTGTQNTEHKTHSAMQRN